MRSRRRTAGAGVVVCLLLVASIVVLALRADGREGTESTTNDGGAWLVNQRAGSIGHVNREVEELSAAVRVGEPSSSIEVHQPHGAVVVHNTQSDALVIVDERTHLSVNSVELPERAQVHEYQNGVVIAAAGPFRVWRIDTETLRDVQSLASLPPTWEGQARDVGPFAVANDGTIAISTPDGLLTIQVGGDVETIELGPIGGIDEVVFDGETAVVRDATTLATADGGRLAPVAQDIGSWDRVSAPSIERAGSIAAVQPSGDIVRIDLNSGTTSILGRLNSADPVQPLQYRGCVYAVGHEPPTFWAQCGDDEPKSALLAAQPNMRLRLRIVNEWVWVNDITSGNLWLVDDALDLSLVDDWGAVLPQNSATDDQDIQSADSDNDIVDDVENPDAEDAQTIDDDEFDDGENLPPVAFDDEDFFTHQGRPVYVPVVANDEDPNNDVLLVSTVENLSGADAVVEATSDGVGVQVTPAPGFTGQVRFSYRITDGRGGSDAATGTVTVQARTGADNTVPVAVTDIGSITAGQKLILNVLANDTDPDGDSLILIGVETPAGVVSFDPSGQIIFEPDVTSDEGEITLIYTIADDFGATAEGQISASIRLAESNQPPDARNDGAVTVVSQPVSLNVLANDTDPDGDELFVAQRPVLLSPVDADVFTTITPDGEFVFIPEVEGTFRFSYAASDDEDSDTAQIRIDVSPVRANRPPVAVRDDVVIPQGDSRIVYVLNNDGDPDGDVVSIFDVIVPRGSGLRVESFLDLGFRVFVDGEGPARRTFRYSITDGIAEPVETTVVVAVADETTLNQPPLAQPDIVEIRPGASLAVPVLENDFDPEGGPLQVVGVSNPAGATTEISSEQSFVRVSVAPSTVTSFSFTYDVADEQGNRTASVVRVRVVPTGQPNRPPIARPDSARTAFETELSISAIANDSDPDGDAIRVESITAQPANGTAVADPVSGDVIYTPAAGFSGTDRFSYAVVDALGARTNGEVLVGVSPEPRPNRPPVAVDDSFLTVATGETLALTVLSNDSDPDGDQLRITTFDPPTAGSIARSIDGRRLSYQAPVDQADDVVVEVGYGITDGNGGVANATITVLVQATPPQPQGAPVAVLDEVGPFETGDEVRVDVVANDSDSDGPTSELDVSVFDAELRVEGQQVVLVAPAATSEYSYQLTDNDGNTAVAPIIVTIFNPVPPVAIDDQFGPVKQGDVVEIEVLVNDFDPDGEPGGLQLLAVTGDAEVAGDVIRVTAPAASTQYTYTIADESELEATASISLLVAENRAPQLLPQAVTTPFGEPVLIDLGPSAIDPDDDALFFSCCQSTRGGSPVVLDAGEGVLIVEFTPDDDFSGDAVFTYEVDDQFGHVVAGTVTVTVEPQPNRPPTTVDGAASIQVPRLDGPPITVEVDLEPLSDDLDEDVLSWEVAEQPGQRLTAQVVGSVLVIEATDQSQAGSTTVGFTVTDPEAESASGTIEVAVEEPQNEPPIAVGRAVTIAAGNSTTVDLGELATDGDADEILTFVIDAPAAPGLTITQTGEQIVTIAAAVNASGTTSLFDYTVTDRMLEPATAQVDIEVGDPDQAPPEAVDDVGDTIQGVPVSVPVLANDSDPLGQGLTIVDGGTSTDGAITVTGSTIEFAPTDDFFGSTSFEYTIQDAAEVASRESSATVSIEVTGRPAKPGAPTCTADSTLANLTWTAPDGNGASIDGYEIEHDQGGADTLGVTTSHEWSGLTNGTEYEFRIAARNVAGLGEWSEWSLGCTPDIEPERPAAPQVTHGNGFLEVTWTEPVNNGSPIEEYQIRIGGGTVQTSTDTSLRWTDLNNGESYTFQVAASNAKGRSVFSPLSQPEHPSTTPDAPVIGVTTRAGLIGASASGILEINWSPVPVGDDGGDTVQRYRIERRSGGSAIANGANASSYTWSGLPNGVDNEFRVIAINRDGDSVPSAWSQPTRACTVPTAPGGLNAVRGDRQAQVTFAAPGDDGGCQITDYDVRIAGSTGTGTSHSSPGTVTVSGLANGTSYAFDVRANNVIGSSGWVTTAAVTPAAAPICGANFTIASIGHNSASFTWSGANWNGGTGQGYELSVNSGTWTFVSNSGSGSTSLSPSSSYTVRLRARNDLGPSPVCGTVNFQTCPSSPAAPPTPAISVNQTARSVTTNWSTVSVPCTSQSQVGSAYDIVRYEVQADTLTDEGLATTKTYTSLAPGTSVSVRVRACFTSGCGAFSPWSAWVTVNALGTIEIGLGSASSYPATACWNASSIFASGGNPSQGCYHVRITLAGWSGTHTVRCFSTMNTGVWQEFDSFVAGNGTYNRCSYSQAGRWVIAVVDGTVQGQPNGWRAVAPPAVASVTWGQWPTN